MIVQFGLCRLELVEGDITKQEVDVIVNAANLRLAGGGGVDGAIHRVGGPAIMEETRRRYPDGCQTGNAVVTAAGNLNAKHVLHAVGPVWRGGQHDEADLLRSAVQSCLKLAVELECSSIAFPAISTGIFRYPIDRAAEESLNVVRDFLLEHGKPKRARFVLFGEGAYGAFARILEGMCD